MVRLGVLWVLELMKGEKVQMDLEFIYGIISGTFTFH